MLLYQLVYEESVEVRWVVLCFGLNGGVDTAVARIPWYCIVHLQYTILPYSYHTSHSEVVNQANLQEEGSRGGHT